MAFFYSFVEFLTGWSLAGVGTTDGADRGSVAEKSDMPELLALYGATELTGDIVRKFIEKIVVAGKDNLEIFWKA